ncbi:hypothetical protein [Halomonas alimentaria]|uniref:Uncharacterized protein n=1 Tax=Halomonas alimentaria TaxID=147248 RepID=A0A7X4W3W9_9GAMM|nr:hypothetical protein [Halomonas alimentaria]NAW33765.1 hypothetical protein [Halomonas alimentaria]
MSSDLISVFALFVSIASLLWSWKISKAASSVAVAEKLSNLKITATEAVLFIENKLNQECREESDDFYNRQKRLRRILEKLLKIRAQLDTKTWRSSSKSVVELQEISGLMLEVLKELEAEMRVNVAEMGREANET